MVSLSGSSRSSGGPERVSSRGGYRSLPRDDGAWMVCHHPCDTLPAEPCCRACELCTTRRTAQQVLKQLADWVEIKVPVVFVGFQDGFELGVVGEFAVFVSTVLRVRAGDIPQF